MINYSTASRYNRNGVVIITVIIYNNSVQRTCQVQRSVGVDVSGADGASCGAPLQQQAVVRPAQQLVLPQRELVSRQQLPAAHRAPKALDVVHVIPGSHHQVAATEPQVAFCAFYSKQPGRREKRKR